MSRAFLKNDGEVPEEPVKRQSSGRPNYVTPAGLEALKARIAELAELRSRLLAAKKPGEEGGLPLRQAETDLSYYETQFKRAILVDHRGLAAEDARFGARVTVKDQDGAGKEYFIVGEDEADPAAGRLNWASPLATALIGVKAGDEIVFSRKGEETRLKIVAVAYPK